MEISHLPQEWSLRKLGEIALIETGGSAPQGEKYFTNGKNKFIRVQHFDGTREYVDRWDLITDEAVTVKHLKPFPAETIVFPKSGASIHLEKRAKLPDTCYVVSHLCCVQPKYIVGDFLFYWLKYIPLASAPGGSTLPYLNLAELKNKLVPVPPLPEQRIIAAILSTVQRAIEQQERLIALTTELKKALMHKLFTEGTRGEPQKMTEIGPIPESWEVVRLGDVIEQAQYGLSLKGTESGNYPMLRMTNQVNGRIIPNDLQWVEINTNDFAKFALNRGDLLFNRTNSFELVGRTAIFDLDGDYVFASYLIRLRVDRKRINPFFLNHYLNNDITQQRLKSIATRAVSQSNISATRLKVFLIPLPILEEQNEVVGVLDALDIKIGVHEQYVRSFKEIFRTLLHQLMTAQIRVNEIEFENFNSLGEKAL